METHYSISKSLNQPYYHQPERTILLYKINKVNSDPGGEKWHVLILTPAWIFIQIYIVNIYRFICLCVYTDSCGIQETRKGSGLSGKRDRRVGKKRRLRNNTKDVFKSHVETLLFLRFPLYDMHI